MGLKDWLGLGAQGVDWYQQRANLGDAKDAVQEGYEQGAQDLKRYNEPYTQFGLEHMEGYNNLGEFDFQFDESDPSYQWRRDQGLQGVMREQAGQKMVGSGNTLTALTDYGQGAASQEYQAEFNRDLSTYQQNRGYHEFGVGTGAKAAQNLGDNLASMAVGEGADMSKLYAAQATINNKAISQVAGQFTGGDAGAAVDMLKQGWSYASDKLGLSGDAAIDWLSDKAGVAKDAIQGILGVGGGGGAAAGAAGMFGTSTGLSSGAGAMAGGYNAAAGMGSLSADFGGSFSAALGEGAGAGAAAGSAAGWAMSTAGGLGLLFGIKSVVEMLRGSPSAGETFKTISESDDPIQTILDGGLPMGGALSGSDPKWTDATRSGSLLNVVLSKATPEQTSALRYHPEIDTIVANLREWQDSGNNIVSDFDGGLGNSEALMAMFPEIAGELEFLGKHSVNLANKEEGETNWWEGERGDNIFQARALGYTYDEASAKVNTYIDEQLAKWANQRQVRSLAAQ